MESMNGEVESILGEVKLPKVSKTIRYYYRHREEILEQRRQKRLEDPEYEAKVQAREEANRAKEEAKRVREEANRAKEGAKRVKEAERDEKRRVKAKFVGAAWRPGSTETAC